MARRIESPQGDRADAKANVAPTGILDGRYGCYGPLVTSSSLQCDIGTSSHLPPPPRAARKPTTRARIGLPAKRVSRRARSMTACKLTRWPMLTMTACKLDRATHYQTLPESLPRWGTR